MTVLYWTLRVNNYRYPDEVHDLAISLSRGGDRNRDWARYVRELFIQSDTVEDEDILSRMLESMPFVECIELNQVWTPGILAACARACAASLKTLIIIDREPGEYRYFGSFLSLTAINIANSEMTPTLDSVDGLQLPALSSITWGGARLMQPAIRRHTGHPVSGAVLLPAVAVGHSPDRSELRRRAHAHSALPGCASHYRHRHPRTAADRIRGNHPKRSHSPARPQTLR
jgi:hypothetical protein